MRVRSPSWCLERKYQVRTKAQFVCRRAPTRCCLGRRREKPVLPVKLSRCGLLRGALGLSTQNRNALISDPGCSLSEPILQMCFILKTESCKQPRPLKVKLLKSGIFLL